MALIRQRLRNGSDSIPPKAESFDINFMGPAKKNLLVPKAEENMLRINDTSGKAESMSGK